MGREMTIAKPSWWRAIARAGLLLTALGWLGCADARAARAVGPDGADDWWKVSCRSNQENCMEKAAELCDGGSYEVATSEGRYDVGPGFPFYSGVLLVRCTGAPARAPR